CNGYLPQGRNQTSLPQSLTVGKAYYIEALYKEGTGGDYMQVAAAMATDPIPVSAPPDSIPSSMVGSPAVPTEASDPATITQQPADTTVIEGSTATFSVGVTSPHSLPRCYQWQRNGTDIPGANGSSYSFVTAPGDDGALFSVSITPIGAAGVVSSQAKLHIGQETTPPTIVSVTARCPGTTRHPP